MRLKQIIQLKFFKDVSRTFLATIFSGLSLILLNAIIGWVYDPEGLGVFTTILSIVMILGIPAVFGVHHSVVKHVAEAGPSPLLEKQIMQPAISLILLISISLTALCLLLNDHIEWPLQMALQPALLALPFIALNKLFLGLFNANRRMGRYAAFQSARAVTLLALCLSFSLAEIPIIRFGWCFFFAEASVTFILLLSGQIRYWPGWDSIWVRRHFEFGKHLILNDVCLQINMRVDQLSIAYFWGLAPAGVYAFASEVAKGLLQLPLIVQHNFNPIISRLWAGNNIQRLNEQISNIKKQSYYLYTPMFLMVAVGYPFYLGFFGERLLSIENLVAFYILITSIFLVSGYYGSLGLLFTTGNSRDQATVAFYTLGLNLIGNLILVPPFGMVGAAVSTSLSYFGSLLLFHRLTFLRLGIRLWES